MSQHDKYLSFDDDINGTADDDMDSFSDDMGNETDITTYDDDTDSLSGDSDNDIDDEESLFNDEERHLLEYYLDGAVKLDPKQLRQKRYRERTQARLDWVKEHCIQ
jgi:hypothetical protein